MIARYLPIAVVAFALAPAAVACGGEDPADDVESGEGAANATQKQTVDCAWEDNPSDLIRASLEGTTYSLEISESKGKGLISGDPKPDNWTFKKVEGNARLYTGKPAELPVTLTLGGRWSLIQVLSVPKGIVEGKAGTITISHYVTHRDDDTFTPLAKADEKDQIERMDNVPDGAEAANRAITKEIVQAVLKAKCKS